MTDSDVARRAIAAGIDFARRQRNPRFRQMLASIGNTSSWRPGDDVVVAFDDDPVFSVLHKIILNAVTTPCLIAIVDTDELYGYRFLLAEAADNENRHRPHVTLTEIAPQSSIGMLYSALQPCGEFVPNAWTKSVMFEKVPTPA